MRFPSSRFDATRGRAKLEEKDGSSNDKPTTTDFIGIISPRRRARNESGKLPAVSLP